MNKKLLKIPPKKKERYAFQCLVDKALWQQAYRVRKFNGHTWTGILEVYLQDYINVYGGNMRLKEKRSKE